MADCMFAALCTPLSFLGLDLQPEFVGELRKASGVAVFDKKGKPQGTSTAASQRAITKLFGELPGLMFGGLDDTELLDGLESGDFVARVIVANQKLPIRVRRWVGRNWDGFHAIALGGARVQDGQREVFWMDPAGRPKHGYAGEWLVYKDVSGAFQRMPSGKVRVTFGERDAVLEARGEEIDDGETTDDNSAENADGNAKRETGGSAVKLLTHAAVDEFAQLKKGTPFLHPETMETVTRAAGDGSFRLAGRSEDGKFAGVWVKTSRIPGASGLTLLLVDVALIGQPVVGAGQ
jgi:hypothetical protein